MDKRKEKVRNDVIWSSVVNRIKTHLNNRKQAEKDAAEQERIRLLNLRVVTIRILFIYLFHIGKILIIIIVQLLATMGIIGLLSYLQEISID